MKAIIIGGGIAGLSTAVSLEKVGIQCEVYESTPQIREVGAGICMAPNAMQILEKLDLAAKVKSQGHELRKSLLTNQRLQRLSGVDLREIEAQYGFRTTAIHRGRLQQVLLQALPADRVKTGQRFVSFEERGEQVWVNFETGTSTTGDLLIGADGIHSAVRKQLFPAAQLRDAGQLCCRGIATFPLPEALKPDSYECWGKKGRFGFLAVSPTEVYWYTVTTTWPADSISPEARKKELVATFGEFVAPIPELIAATPTRDIHVAGLSDLARLPSWSEGRALLVGDAAHATTPNMGQGGCQAVEDAWYLGRFLGKGGSFRDAFTEFEAARREKVDYIVNHSWRLGKVAHWKFARGLRNAMVRMTPQSVTRKTLHRTFSLPE